MRPWIQKTYYIFHLLTALLFALFISYPAYSLLFDKQSSPMSMKWYDIVGMLVWYGYNILCLKKIGAYLRHPDPDRRFDFILLLLGLMLVLWFLFAIMAMSGEGSWNMGN